MIRRQPFAGWLELRDYRPMLFVLKHVTPPASAAFVAARGAEIAG